MKPIFRQIQSDVIDYLKNNKTFPQAITIMAGDAFSLDDRLQQQSSQAFPLKLCISLPFPLQVAPELSAPCWEKLSLRCALIETFKRLDPTNFIDAAEQISFLIANKLFETKIWNGRFMLAAKDPWKWIDYPQGCALQMNFMTSNFNVKLL